MEAAWEVKQSSFVRLNRLLIMNFNIFFFKEKLGLANRAYITESGLYEELFEEVINSPGFCWNANPAYAD